MLHGKSTDDDWFLRRHVEDIAKGDRIWPYYGTSDDDRGIVGLAIVRSVERSTPSVRLRWDRRATKRLVLDSFRADRVRASIPYPRSTVIDMDAHPQLVNALDRHVSRLEKRA